MFAFELLKPSKIDLLSYDKNIRYGVGEERDDININKTEKCLSFYKVYAPVVGWFITRASVESRSVRSRRLH